MIPESLILFLAVSAVFIMGVSVGQLLLRIRLAKLERANLEQEKERLDALKGTLHSRAIIIEHRVPARFEQDVRDEIDDILGSIENS